ncbi:FAD-linked oxidoreductase [Actinobacteria bacterium IMCC26256]|nr:FAD-linked oxidoreductase [Actinobacteria bacterium IMCC26256]
MARRGAWQNWGRNQTCNPIAIESPRSLLELRELVGSADRAGQRVRIAASGHSFSDIACTDSRMLRIEALDRVIDLDREAMTVTVEAGIKLFVLNDELAKRGLALSNLGDIDKQTLAGALSTGTHGTSHRLGPIAAAVISLELVTANGDLVTCSPTEEPELFECARIGLGVFGIITKVTLQCEPAFRLHSLEEPHEFDEALESWNSITASNDHVDSYWFPHSEVVTIKAANRTDRPIWVKSRQKQWREEILIGNYIFGGLAAYGRKRPSKVPSIARMVANNMGRVEKVDVSHRVFCSERLIRFVEMEYALPIEKMQATLRRIRDLIESEKLQVDFPVEIRALPADDIPLSMANGRETAFLAVHVSSGTPFEKYFRGVEAIMDEVEGRPHWGKMHFQTAEKLAPRYSEWSKFQKVREAWDPKGRFANAYTDRVLGRTY